MERVVNNLQKFITACRTDLDKLEKALHDPKAIDQDPSKIQYDFFAPTIKECHLSMRNKLHMLTTVIETNSTEILDLIKHRA